MRRCMRIAPRLLIFLLVIVAFLLSLHSKSVSAEEQKKQTYLIKVNRVFNTVTVYEKDKEGEYTVPVKAMLCSVGKNQKTVTGTYKTKDKYRWRLLMGDVWGQYATRIVGGILFHSVYYYDKYDPASLATKEFNKLGEAASHGCIRLAVKDAKWIYDNCSYGTTVIIYDDKNSPGPLGKPEAIKIASNVRWDPTDPDKNNPYIEKQPKITGVKSIKLTWGSTYDLLKNLKATSSVGTDITSEVKIDGEVDTTVPGKYKILYSVTDGLDKTITKTITVTVLDNTVEPELVGITDKVVTSKVTIDHTYLLLDVNAYCKDIQLNKDLIQVRINKSSDVEYEITYTASVGNGPVATKKCKIYIDDEAPVLTGITDTTVEDGEVPSKTYVMTGVTANDNFSAVENILIDVIITENPDGTYLVTYTATDEAGNTTTAQANIGN